MSQQKWGCRELSWKVSGCQVRKAPQHPGQAPTPPHPSQRRREAQALRGTGCPRGPASQWGSRDPLRCLSPQASASPHAAFSREGCRGHLTPLTLPGRLRPRGSRWCSEWGTGPAFVCLLLTEEAEYRPGPGGEDGGGSRAPAQLAPRFRESPLIFEAQTQRCHFWFSSWSLQWLIRPEATPPLAGPAHLGLLPKGPGPGQALDSVSGQCGAATSSGCPGGDRPARPSLSCPRRSHPAQVVLGSKVTSKVTACGHGVPMERPDPWEPGP